MDGWLYASLKSTETSDELSTICNLKVMSRCLSAPDATSLHHCLKNKQLKLSGIKIDNGSGESVVGM